jgi:hypothetical protein
MGGFSLNGRAFALQGHDCPLGEYPSVAVPIGNLAGQVVAVYSGDGEPQFRPVPVNARYIRHDQTMDSTLRGFDPVRHGLFALNNREVVTYDLGRERAFYSRLLRSSVAFDIEPFYRLSLAIETEDASLMRPLYFSCARHLRRDAPEFSEAWMNAIQIFSPAFEAIRKEWLRRLEMPESELRYGAGAVASSRSMLPLSEPALFLSPSFGAGMSSVTISRAIADMALYEPGLQVGAAYAVAIRTSFGFADTSDGLVFLRLDSTELDRVPSPVDVSARSGLSLPYLEFRRIVLSKATAIEFLRLSKSELPARFLSHEVLVPAVYERQFHRPPVKIKRRQVFTYAEVLSLVGYRGTLELPSWP